MTKLNYIISIDAGMASKLVSSNETVGISNAFEHEHRTIEVFVNGESTCSHTFELAPMEHLPHFIEAQLDDFSTQMPDKDSDIIKAICLDLQTAAKIRNLGPFDSYILNF